MKKYTNEEIIKACENNESMASVAMKLQIPFSTFKRRALKLDCYKTNQFWNKGKNLFNDNRVSNNNLEDIFAEKSKVKKIIRYKEELKKLLGDVCEKCGLNNIWEGEHIELELDHVNGEHNDNRLENLRFLCPNCHSQTKTFRGKNIKKKLNNDGFYKYSVEELFKSVTESKNFTELCNKLKITPARGNYETLKKKMKEYNLYFGSTNDVANIPMSVIKSNNCKCGKIISKNSIFCVECSHLNQRKYRPELSILLEESKTLGYSATGRKYGVSGNCIKKWIKKGI